MTEDPITKILEDRIYSLIKNIWGKKKTKKGFCWVASKFGNDWSRRGELILHEIFQCLSSKDLQITCTVHGRVHEG